MYVKDFSLFCRLPQTLMVGVFSDLREPPLLSTGGWLCSPGPRGKVSTFIQLSAVGFSWKDGFTISEI